jgi:hypothetical protein
MNALFIKHQILAFCLLQSIAAVAACCVVRVILQLPNSLIQALVDHNQRFNVELDIKIHQIAQHSNEIAAVCLSIFD